jgi:hypothetical protein
MSKDDKKWWENRVLRTVDNLKLWSDNPRLDPSSKLVKVRDFVEELISDSTDEQNFLSLLKSIATRGFMAFEPIVIWKNEDEHFMVAEGNRRVMALKLLRDPNKAPMSIRKVVVNYSRMIDRDDIEKIKVCLAPSYEDSRWYILQRHSPMATEQVRWQRLQQQRFIINVYDSTGQKIDETIDITGFKRSAIIEALRYVKIRDIATRPEVTAYLTFSEKEQVYSHKISMSVLERWFGNSVVRKAWHIEFNENGATINADEASFYAAYAQFLKLMFSKDNELGFKVDTRKIDTHFKEIFDYLPKVKSLEEGKASPTPTTPPDSGTPDSGAPDSGAPDSGTPDSGTPDSGTPDKPIAPVVQPVPDPKPSLKGNPKRLKLTDTFHDITAKNYKLKALFEELQKLPVRRYPNVSAASIRIFLELAVDEYVNSADLKGEVARRKERNYDKVTLSEKLNLLRDEFIDDRDANNTIRDLSNYTNDFSLSTLNGYIHGNKVDKVEPQFLNRFWDMLSPLLSVLINLREI